MRSKKAVRNKSQPEKLDAYGYSIQYEQMIISSTRTVPTVSVTGRPGHRQLRIAFNPALVRTAKLESVRFLGVESGVGGAGGETWRFLKFTPSKTYAYRSKNGEEGQALSLSPDGGNKNGTALALYVSKATFSFLPTGKYTPTIDGNVITITYEEQP